MKKVVCERAVTDPSRVDRLRAINKVPSLSCVVADAQQRDDVVRSEIWLRTGTDKKIRERGH